MPLSWSVLLSFLGAVVVIQLVPGPGMLFIIANGVAGGRRAGVAAAFGAATGVVVQTAAAAAGLSALFAAAPAAFDVVRFVGVAYLAWLAVKHWRSAGLQLVSEDGAMPAERSPRRVYVRGLLNNLANPKVIVFFIAFLPQFVAPAAGNVHVQLVILGLVFMLVGLVLDVAIGSMAGHIGALLRKRSGLAKLLDRIVGTIFGALAVRLALQRK
jgi:threonine/homoserine/homoserine lactone efflux protein